jgi:CRP-like cAMP-binding protein
MMLSREMQKRLKELAAALKAEPGSIPRRLELAAALREAGRPNDAIELYRGVAEVYAEEGRLVQAMAVCKGILEIDAGHRSTLEMLATLAQRRAQKRPSAEVRQEGGKWVAEPSQPQVRPDASQVEMTPPSVSMAADFSPARRERTPEGLPRYRGDEITKTGDDPDATPIEPLENVHDLREAMQNATPAEGVPLYAEHQRDTANDEAPGENLPTLDFPPETKRQARGSRLADLKFASRGNIDTLRQPTVTDEELRHDTPIEEPPPPGEEVTRAGIKSALDAGREASAAPTHLEEQKHLTDLVWNEEESGANFIEEVITGPFPRQQLLVEPPPFPLLSDLPRSAFVELIARMGVVRLQSGEVVLREGDAGDACYLIVSGAVRVSKKGVELAVLGPGSFFGEFAVLADQRRHASVISIEPVELLEIRRGLLDELVAQHPGVARTLRRFYRERLLSTLVATAPFFAKLQPEERAQVAERFRPRRFGRGSAIIEEGQPGGGLYLILVGEVEVVRAQKDGERVLGTLGEGAYFGEMSLLRGGVASASVRATRMTEAVQLPPRDFYEVVSQHPVLWEQLRSEAQRRELANSALMTGEAHKNDEENVYLV